MAYKPPSQTVTDDDIYGQPSSEAVFELAKEKADVDLGNLSVTGTTGQVLTWGASGPTWDDVTASGGGAEYPTQTGNAGKFLQTNGTDVSWQAVTGFEPEINLTAGRVVVSNASGDLSVSTVTSTTLGYLDVSSSVSGQLAGKQNTITGAASTVTSSDLTASRVVVSDASGKISASTVTSTTLGYLDVSSSVSGALDSKLTNPMNSAGDLIVGGASGTATRLGIGTSEYALISNGSTAGWAVLGTGPSGASYPSSSLILGRTKPTGMTGGESCILGAGAGDAVTSGTRNVLCGIYSAGNLTTGGSVIAIGYGAGYSSGFSFLTTGSRDILIGTSASTAAASTSDAVAIGDSSVAAQNSVSIGTSAGRYITGTNSVSIGHQSMLSVSASGTGANNCAIGSQALYSLTSGSSNVAIGTQAASGLTSVSNTVTVGASASCGETNSVAIGTSAAAGGGNSNVVVGASAGRSAGTGQANCVVGYLAGSALTTGNKNVFIGSNLPSFNSAAGQACTSGQDDIFIGVGAGANVTTGSQLTLIGRGAVTSAVGDNRAVGVGFGLTVADSSTALGADTTANGTSSIAIGRAASTNSTANICAIGSASYQINTVYLGRGAATQTTGNAVKIMTMQASGTNTSMTAGTLTLSGAQGTGTGAGGDVIVSTAPSGASGTSLNAHVERLRVTSAGDVKTNLYYTVSPQRFAGGAQTSSFNIDWNNGAVQEFTLNVSGGTVSLSGATWSNPVTGGCYMLKLIQGATPTSVSAWPSSVKWGLAGAPALSSTSGLIDIVNLFYDGTNYYGTYALGY